MKDDKKYYRIISKKEPFNQYQVFAELVNYMPAEDEYGCDTYIFKELLTGLKIYSGYDHPIVDYYYKSNYYYDLERYICPNKIVNEIKNKVGNVDGLYFYAKDFSVFEVSPNEIKDYYTSLSPSVTIKYNLYNYLKTFDDAVTNQEQNAEDRVKNAIEIDRLEHIYGKIHENDRSDAEVYIHKLTNK